jgi:CTP synthase
MLKNHREVKYIVVTGGVLSGLGKGVAAASIGSLHKQKLKIVPIKCDGYLNTDPGTMNPIEHGEVFVLDDGGEVDMDFGHYERFLGINAKSGWSITMGKVYKQILENERKGIYLGKTVQLIPHVTDEIKSRIQNIAQTEKADLVLIEIGGTIGDMEIELFVESVRQLQYEVGRENLMFVHLTYVPVPSGTKEQKSKPTQTSVRMLNQAGIYPDLIIGRCKTRITEAVRQKIALSCNVALDCVISGIDVNPIYDLPLVFEEQGVAELIHKRLHIYSPPELEETRRLVGNLKKLIKQADKTLNIALCGKYTDLEDSYASINDALLHCSAHLGVKINKKFIDTTEITSSNVAETLIGIDGVIVPGGFGNRGLEGKIEVIRYLRENDIPFLGICLGMQLAVIEYARNVCGMKGANSTEIERENIKVEVPVIDLLPEQKGVTNMGGTMRLGGHDVEIHPGTKAFEFFGGPMVRRRFRHRYEVNPEYIEKLEKGGLVFSGKAPGREIMQVIELPGHRFFMGSQFHPELTSRLEKPDELFYHFVSACMTGRT